MGLNIHCGCLDIFTFTKLRDVQSSYGKINCFFFVFCFHCVKKMRALTFYLEWNDLGVNC